MYNDEDRRRKMTGKRSEDSADRVETSGRSTDDDDVPHSFCWHVGTQNRTDRDY